MSELKKRQRQINEKKVLNRDDVYHGALEDILLGVWGSLVINVSLGGGSLVINVSLGVSLAFCKGRHVGSLPHSMAMA